MVRSILLALAFVVGVSGLAQAQDVTLITVARKQVQPDVIQITAPSPITLAMVPTETEFVVLSADIAPSDYLDPTKSFWLRLRVSSDGGLNWRGIAQAHFVGASDNPPGGWVGVAVQAVKYKFDGTLDYTLVGALVRLELDVPVRMSIGGSVTVALETP